MRVIREAQRHADPTDPDPDLDKDPDPEHWLPGSGSSLHWIQCGSATLINRVPMNVMWLCRTWRRRSWPAAITCSTPSASGSGSTCRWGIVVNGSLELVLPSGTGTATFCLSGTGTVVHSGSGSNSGIGLGLSSYIKKKKKCKTSEKI